MVSEVNIVPIKPNDGLIAFASVVVNRSLYLGSIGVHSRPNGSYRITYPTKRLGNKELSLYHPINRDIGQQIELAVIAKCQQIFEGSDEDDRHNKASCEVRQPTTLQGKLSATD
ncbi:septation protein SpoVG family protein [bacterium]|nr:septation protein SpoVG family protein [bacterium]